MHEGDFNVPTLLDETSLLFVQTIHYVSCWRSNMPVAGVFITKLKRVLSDSGRLMTGPEPESPRKP